MHRSKSTVRSQSSSHWRRGSANRCAAFQARIDATDREIDRLVYDLYGLTEEEIAIVEGAAAK
jgi:hypothetical protein